MTENLFYLKRLENSQSLSYSSSFKTRIILNARGIKYDLLIKNFQKYPSYSRIGKLISCLQTSQDLNDVCDDYNLDTFEFYFDRDPFILNSILNYYSYGELHLNDNGCIDLFSKELEYWGIDIFELHQCCISKYSKKRNEIDEDIKKEKEILKEHTQKDDFGDYLPELREKIWKILTYDEKSTISKVKFDFKKFCYLSFSCNLKFF